MSEIFGGPKSQTVDGSVAVSNVLDDPVGAYHITDIDTSAATQYFGYTNAAGNWFIMQLTSTAARYAKGTSAYTTAWTGRAAPLPYDYWYTTF